MSEVTGGESLLATTGRQMAIGTAWTVAMRWVMRFIGVASTAVLARLLTPRDFGLVAMAMVVVGFVEILGETGQRLALIRHSNLTRVQLDTAWTLSVCQGAALAAVMWLVAPLGADYFREPRASMLVRVLAFRAFIGGFENIGIIAFRKDLDFAKDFRFNVYQKLFTFVLTLAAALTLGNYWALAIGIISGRAASTVLSYRMHSYRPRPSFAAIRELWSYSNWMLAVHLGDYVHGKIDELIVGRVANTSWMGYYNAGADLGTAPTMELVLPMSRALFPGYAKLAGRADDLRRAYTVNLSVVAMLSLSTGLGMMLVAADVVPLVLGKQWRDAVPLVSWLALAGALAGIGSSAFTLLSVSGHARTAGVLGWFRNVVIIPALIAAGTWWGTTGVAAARTAVTVLLLPVMLATAARAIQLSFRQILAALWRPAIAGLAMVLVVGVLNGAMQPGVIRLACDVVCGAMVYAGCLFGTWFLAGRPADAEAILLAYAASAYARLRRAGKQSAGVLQV